MRVRCRVIYLVPPARPSPELELTNRVRYRYCTLRGAELSCHDAIRSGCCGDSAMTPAPARMHSS